jgi:hypothetical protein
MNNKKVAFLILSFAVVAALLTMYGRSKMRMDGLCGPGEYCSGETISAGSATVGYPTTVGGFGLSAPAVKQVETINIGERAPMLVPATDMYTIPNQGDDALDVSMRVYDKTAYQGVVVSNVSEYMKQVRDYIQSINGKVLSSNQNTSDDMRYAYITAKVPAEKFDDVTAMISTKAKKVVNESINVSDVTGQQVAMSDRMVELQELKAKKATELAAAKTEADKQRIQAEIDRIDKQAVQLQKSQEQFTEQVQYATISLTAADSERYFKPEMSGGIQDEMKKAWSSLGGTGSMIAHFLVWVIVYAVIWLPLILAARWVWSKMHPSSKSGK